MTRLRNALIIALLLAALGLAWDAHLAITSLRQEAELTLQHANRDLIVIGGTLANIEKATRAAKDAADEQRVYWNQIGKQTNLDLIELHALLENMGEDVRALKVSIGNADSAIRLVSEQSAASIKLVGDTVASAHPAIQALTETATYAAKLTGDPALPATLAHLEQTTEQVEGIARDAHKTTTVIAGMAVASQKPKNRALTYLGMAAKVLEFLFYAKHQ